MDKRRNVFGKLLSIFYSIYPFFQSVLEGIHKPHKLFLTVFIWVGASRPNFSGKTRGNFLAPGRAVRPGLVPPIKKTYFVTKVVATA